MAPVRDARVLALRHETPRGSSHVESIATEAPLEIRLGGAASTVLMRTPGDDEELVSGFLFDEGLIQGVADIVALRRPATSGDETGNVIDVELVPSRYVPVQRLFYSSSSCGVCGKNSIAALAIRAEPCASRLAVRRSVLVGLPARMREAQPAYRATGGVHAAGLFAADGALDAVREDVGRHNAVDKLVGWALAKGLVPLAGHGLLVSGRVSYEIVQKAIAAGVPIVASVGAPSSLAVDLAVRFGITLVGFLRADAMNVYAYPERIVEG
ncbi:MAG: formate dehydrogenase accessory sulfurtransferase FdhD [Planctomycetota bacterium]